MERLLTPTTRLLKAGIYGLGLAASAVAFVPLASAAIMPYTADSDTAALYHLNNATGDFSTSSYISDSSANGLDLRSPTGGSSPFLGVAGPDGLDTAATFTPATTRAFRFGDNTLNSKLEFDQFTIEGWVRNPTGLNPAIFYLQDQGASQRVFFRLNQNASGAAVQLVFNNASTGTTALTSATRTVLAADTWYHVAVTYDDQGATTANDSIVNFYLTPVTSETRVSVGGATTVADLKALGATGQLLEIGGSGGNNELGGNLDELRYSNTVRDSFNLIPEPGSMTLIGLGALAILRRRRA